MPETITLETTWLDGIDMDDLPIHYTDPPYTHGICGARLRYPGGWPISETPEITCPACRHAQGCP